MFGAIEFLCVELKRSVASMLPWDIPWYDPSHAVFFCALYGAICIIGIGVLAALLLTLARMARKDEPGHGHH